MPLPSLPPAARHKSNLVQQNPELRIIFFGNIGRINPDRKDERIEWPRLNGLGRMPVLALARRCPDERVEHSPVDVDAYAHGACPAKRYLGHRKAQVQVVTVKAGYAELKARPVGG